jgi:ABC-type enterochelin transport system permease subunit
VFEKFIERILNNPYVLSIGVLGILGLVAFLALPAQKKNRSNSSYLFLS